MKALRTLNGILGLTCFIAGTLQIPALEFLFSNGPWGIGISILVGFFLAYSIGQARNKEGFSWTEEIIWSIWWIVLYIFIALTPIPLGGFIVANAKYLCVGTGVVVFITNLTQ